MGGGAGVPILGGGGGGVGALGFCIAVELVQTDQSIKFGLGRIPIFDVKNGVIRSVDFASSNLAARRRLHGQCHFDALTVAIHNDFDRSSRFQFDEFLLEVLDIVDGRTIELDEAIVRL